MTSTPRYWPHHRPAVSSPQVSLSRPRRRARGGFSCEPLEHRLVLDGTGFPGNECPPDLNLSQVAPQTALVGQEFVLNLLTSGGTVVDLEADGDPTGDPIRFVLDPDVPADTPAGATISAAGEFRWTPTAEQVGVHQIVVIAVDSGTPRLADAEVFTITVTTQPPAIDLNGPDTGTGFAATFTEGSGGVLIVDSNLTVTDPDSSSLTGATIRITNLQDGDAESLSVDTTGTAITATYDPITGTLTLSGSDSLANYQSVLRTLRYNNADSNPGTTARTVDVTVTDGTNTSNVATATITVIAINSAPNMSVVSNVQADLGNLVEVTITASDPEGNMLTFLLDRDDPNSTIPASATLTQTDNNTAIIRWTADGTGVFTFVVLVVDDGDPPGADREQFTVTIVDPAPTVDLNSDEPGTGFATTFTEDGGAVLIVGAAASVADADDTDLQSATISLVTRPNGVAESLSVDTSGTGLSASYDAVSGILSITGSGTLAEYTMVLRTLRYQNQSQAPSTAPRTVRVSVSDGTHPSVPAEATITVVGVDDAPELTLPPPYDDPNIPIAAVVGGSLNFTAVASDLDTPPGEIMFSLDLSEANFGTGAALPTITSPPGNVPGGVFSWSPSETGTFRITVLVTDATGLTDEQSFTVEVALPAEGRHRREIGGAVIPQAVPLPRNLEMPRGASWDGSSGPAAESSHLRHLVAIPQGQDRAGGLAHNFLGDTPHQEPQHAGASVRPHDNQLNPFVLGKLHDFVSRIATDQAMLEWHVGIFRDDPFEHL